MHQTIQTILAVLAGASIGASLLLCILTSHGALAECRLWQANKKADDTCGTPDRDQKLVHEQADPVDRFIAEHK